MGNSVYSFPFNTTKYHLFTQRISKLALKKQTFSKLKLFVWHSSEFKTYEHRSKTLPFSLYHFQNIYHFQNALTAFTKPYILHLKREENNSLPFLDVLVEKSDTGFLTSVYRQPTFSGLYTRWNSFCPKQRKFSLIKMLTHRALMICSKSKLHSELEEITKIFLENGYPEDVISVYIKEKIGNFSADVKFGPQKCSVYLKLPWIGDSSLRFESQIKQAITNCFFAVNPRVVYSTKKALPSIQKECVPATQESSVVYEFTCQWNSGYVGRTTQRSEDRIKQHVPSNIRNKTHPQREQPPRSCKSKITTKTCDSAIGQHLLENPDCAKNYNGDMFRIIGKVRSSFHLAVLESIYINTKKPLLCRQKEFVFTLGLHW